MLTPASIGTEWFRRHVLGRAFVLGLSPRLTFVGTTAPYPKDLMLTVWGGPYGPGFGCWNWRNDILYLENGTVSDGRVPVEVAAP
jgi:hypothetical protein